MRDDEADLELMRSAAREAGTLAMRFFRQSPNSWVKLGGSPVTEADVAVDNFLRETLLRARPGYGWLSEETADDPLRLGCEAVFVVDPIDGTRGFIEGDDCWCVSMAVVRDGRPVVAVINAPARGEFFAARKDRGAYLADTRLSVSDRSELAGARVAGPRGWLKTEAIQSLRAELEPHVPSLAYRLTLVAANRVDAAFASPRSNDWDLAAADLLVHEAGGRLTALDGTVPRYNREISRHGVLAATNPLLQTRVLAAVAAAEREVSGQPKRRS